MVRHILAEGKTILEDRRVLKVDEIGASSRAKEFCEEFWDRM